MREEEAGDAALPSRLPRPPTPAPEGAGEAFVIRRGIGGRLRVMAAGTRWWAERHDSLFFAYLRATGNIKASARAAGFTAQSARNRRKRRPDFALACEAALEEAAMTLESELTAEARRRLGGYALDFVRDEDNEAAEANAELDVWLAIWLLRRWDRQEELAARRALRAHGDARDAARRAARAPTDKAAVKGTRTSTCPLEKKGPVPKGRP